MKENKENILYVAYTGLLEPLGQSQVLAYLTRLSKNYTFTLVTYEKSEDYRNHKEVKRLNDLCQQYDIEWNPRIYHKNPRLLATSFDLMLMIQDIFHYSKSRGIKLVHCRSYIPAIAAYLVGKFTKTPFVFDMRALWPEEMVDAGRLSERSLIYKALKYLEKKLLKNSAANVSLTHAAIPYLVETTPNLSMDKFSVIPTCVDLTRFDSEGETIYTSERKTLGTMGTVVSGWYHLDWLFKTLKMSSDFFPSTEFKIVTKDSKKVLTELAEQYSLEHFSVEQCAPDSIQAAINGLEFGILYFTSGVSKIGSAPTRMAEFLACGKPILGNRGVGDMADLIEKYNIGVVIENGNDDEILRGLEGMKQFLQDEDYPNRCRKAACELFSSDVGAERYRLLYESCIK